MEGGALEKKKLIPVIRNSWDIWVSCFNYILSAFDPSPLSQFIKRKICPETQNPWPISRNLTYYQGFTRPNPRALWPSFCRGNCRWFSSAGPSLGSLSQAKIAGENWIWRLVPDGKKVLKEAEGQSSDATYLWTWGNYIQKQFSVSRLDAISVSKCDFLHFYPSVSCSLSVCEQQNCGVHPNLPNTRGNSASSDQLNLSCIAAYIGIWSDSSSSSSGSSNNSECYTP